MAITSVTGSLTHGATVTIAGSGFGTKPAQAPWKWDPMNGVSGTSFSTDARGWIASVNTPVPSLTNAIVRATPGRTTSVVVGQTGANVPALGFGDNVGNYLTLTGSSTLRPPPLSNVLLDYWMYYDPGTAPANNFKWLRFHSSNSPGTNNSYWGAPGGFGFTDTNLNGKSNLLSQSVMANGWHHYTWILRLRATVFIRFYVDGVLYMNTDASGNYILSPGTPGGVTTGPWNQLITGSDYVSTWINEMQNDTAGGGSRSSKQYIADLYVDDGFGRVVLGNAATFGSCTHTETQPYTAWGDAAIQIALNRGTFGSGAAVYLYVLDATDTPVGPGFPLTLGAGPVAPAFTSAASTTLSVGSAGSFLITTAPAATTITRSGTLPSGLVFADAGTGTATLTGTPAAGTAGTYPLTWTATNAGGSATQAFTLTVTGAAGPTFTSAVSTTFTVGVPGTFSVTAAPDVTSITEAGALPTGVIYSGMAGTTTLVPSTFLTTWAPGVRGIPNRTTIFATINPATYSNGAVNASAGIQAAIDACPAGQVVRLMAGDFLVNDFLLINKAITLRGAGIGATGTRLFRTEVGQEQIIIIGPDRFPRIDDATSVNLTADAVKGAYTVTVTSGTGFAAGQFVKLDEDDYTTASLQPMPARISGSIQSVLQSDRLSWPIHNPPNELGELPVPDGLSWHSRAGRPLSEIKEVASVSGTTITFTTALHAAYTTAKTAQLTRYTGAANIFTTYAGVEDLVTDGGADGNISLLCTAYCWVRNCEVKNYGNPGIDIRHGFRLEIRDCYIHDTVAPVPGGGGYAMSLQQGASEVLIENNIVIYCNKVMVCRSAGAGSVVGYNYLDDALIDYNPVWQEVGLNASHMLGGHHVLFEGNRCFNYDSDETWGSAIYMTVFRNHLTGQRRSFTDTDNVRCIGLSFGSWWHAFLGNVLGRSGLMAGWVYEDPGDGTYGNSSSVWGVQTKAIYRIGYSTLWEQSPDPLTVSRLIREGNFDYLTNSVIWAQAPQVLPPSLYLSARPGFFGAGTWPWVDALGVTKLASLPAYDRYTGILANADPGVLPPLATSVNGSLSGTPAVGTAGGYPLTFTATNANGSTAQVFTLTVVAGVAILSVPVAMANMQQQGMS